LIDDMSLGPQIQVDPPEGAVAGFWFTASDDSNASLYPGYSEYGTGELFTYREIDPPVTPDGGPTIERAACVKSDGFRGWTAMMGFNFAVNLRTSTPVSMDVSRYSGISFWARTFIPRTQQAISVQFPDGNTNVDDPESTCNQEPDEGVCGDNFARYGVVLERTWTQYFVRWDELTQDPAVYGSARFEALDQEKVGIVAFMVKGSGPNLDAPPFDFCVSHIYFTED
jgi:hypothetical protein